MAAHAIAITTTEDTVEAVMIGTTRADHREEEVQEEKDGELPERGIIRFIEGGCLLTIVTEDTDRVPDLDHIHCLAIKA